MTWALEVYDTQMGEARMRRYTSSVIDAKAWERIPRIQFTDSGHGLVFIAVKHTPRAPRHAFNEYGYAKHTALLPELRRQVRAERRKDRS